MTVALALAAALAGASPDAGPQPDQEVRSALGACLAAIIDRAPVASARGQHVEVRIETEPRSCTVRVDAGDPTYMRAAALEALARRKERFSPAKTAWDSAPFASREAFCSAPGQRAISVMVSTAKPGEPLALVATVLEARERDTRCDRDEGLQRPSLAASG